MTTLDLSHSIVHDYIRSVSLYKYMTSLDQSHSIVMTSLDLSHSIVHGLH